MRATTWMMRSSSLAMMAGLALSAQVAAAQLATDPQTPTAPAATEAPAEDIVVTGSRIRRDPLDQPSPVVTLDEAAIARTGLSSIADVLQRLPASSGGLNSKFNNSGNFGNPPDGGGVGAGSAGIDLRYLGAKRTLVLVDGLRYVNGASASGIPGTVDLNSIPDVDDRARRSAAVGRLAALRIGRDRRRRQHHHQGRPEGLQGLGAIRPVPRRGRRRDAELSAAATASAADDVACRHRRLSTPSRRRSARRTAPSRNSPTPARRAAPIRSAAAPAPPRSAASWSIGQNLTLQGGPRAPSGTPGL